MPFKNVTAMLNWLLLIGFSKNKPQFFGRTILLKTVTLWFYAIGGPKYGYPCFIFTFAL